MRKLLVSVVSLFCLVSIASAQNTVFVPCWTGKNSEVYRSTKVKGAVIYSATGERAYVTAAARAIGGACLNVSQLYVAGPTGEFRKVFEAQPTKTYDGNGMRLIGWNQPGTKLMAELGRFPYGSDVDMARELIVYDSTSNKVSHLDVDAVLAKYFTQDCAFVFETKAWHGSGAAVVAVRQYKDELDATLKSCVQRPTDLIVELSTGAVSRVSSR
jgi:hypothetical protein